MVGLYFERKISASLVCLDHQISQ